MIHVLLPQDRLLWSTGANLLFTCNSNIGPVSGWDVLSGAKVVQLTAHTGAVQALADVPALG